MKASYYRTKGSPHKAVLKEAIKEHKLSQKPKRNMPNYMTKEAMNEASYYRTKGSPQKAVLKEAIKEHKLSQKPKRNMPNYMTKEAMNEASYYRTKSSPKGAHPTTEVSEWSSPCLVHS